jgi:hypothetical protein
MRIEAEHIKRWMTEHPSHQTDTSTSLAFTRYLESFPWLPTRIDWKEIEHATFDMNDYDIASSWEDDIVQFAERTTLINYQYVMLLFGVDEPSLVTEKLPGLRDIDLIYSGTGGARYFCGTEIINRSIHPRYEDFGEFDGVSRIRVRTTHISRNVPTPR